MNTLPPIERLKGRENYDTWKFAVQTYLEHEELWAAVEGTETDAKKITKARSKIILLVDPVNYVHVQSSTTAKEAWDNLEKAFEDSGLTRRDFDKSKCGTVSRTHFLKALTLRNMANLISRNEFDVICKCFSFERGMRDEVDYRAFMKALEILHATHKYNPF